MSTNFQQCSHLLIEDSYKKSENTLKDLIDLQKTIQSDVYGYDFEQMRDKMSKLVDFWKWNQLAIQSELMEAFDALGGIQDGIGNAVWKPWKKKHQDVQDMKLSDLSERDLKDLKMELIDIQHFLFNLMISVGMDAEEIFNYYVAKNQENIERQKRGY
jgi:NTP pyrophosphatase (non-canonical NTP hydrolase)